VLTFADLLPDWDLENWQKYLITKLLEQLTCNL